MTLNFEGMYSVNKNPVWIFPIETTNFIRIQQDVNTLRASVEKISTVPKDSSAYHTGMMDISDRSLLIKTNIMDATPYMYVSIGNILFSVVWIAAIIGIFAALKKKREQFKETEIIAPNEDVLIKLTQSELKFKGIFENAIHGIVIATEEGRILEMNDRFVELLGYSKKELIKLKSSDITHPHAVE